MRSARRLDEGGWRIDVFARFVSPQERVGSHGQPLGGFGLLTFPAGDWSGGRVMREAAKGVVSGALTAGDNWVFAWTRSGLG